MAGALEDRADRRCSWPTERRTARFRRTRRPAQQPHRIARRRAPRLAGGRVAALLLDQDRIAVLEAKSAKETWKLDKSATKDFASDATPDGKRIVTWETGRLRVHDIATGRSSPTCGRPRDGPCKTTSSPSPHDRYCVVNLLPPGRPPGFHPRGPGPRTTILNLPKFAASRWTFSPTAGSWSYMCPTPLRRSGISPSQPRAGRKLRRGLSAKFSRTVGPWSWTGRAASACTTFGRGNRCRNQRPQRRTSKRCGSPRTAAG